MPVVSAQLHIGPPDAFGDCFVTWVGDTVHATGTFPDEDGANGIATSVTFVWTRSDGEEISTPATEDADHVWRSSIEADMRGAWSVRLRCENPSRQTAWRAFSVREGFGAPETTCAPVWLADGAV